MTDTQLPTEILTELRELRSELREQRAKSDSKDTAFRAMHEELQQYKDDFMLQVEKPLLLDLLLFYDSLNWFQESLVKQDMSPDVLEENFQYLIDELLELLYRRNVTPMESSERFDRTKHKAVQVVKTDMREHHELITQVMKRGFQRAETTLRPEEVIVARHKGE